MLRKSFPLLCVVLLTALALSSKAHAWGAYHVGYTHYSPYTGLRHYGYTGAYRGPYGGYGYGYRYAGYGAYGGYHYGVYPYAYGYGGTAYGARYGYYRAW